MESFNEYDIHNVKDSANDVSPVEQRRQAFDDVSPVEQRRRAFDDNSIVEMVVEIDEENKKSIYLQQRSEIVNQLFLQLYKMFFKLLTKKSSQEEKNISGTGGGGFVVNHIKTVRSQGTLSNFKLIKNNQPVFTLSNPQIHQQQKQKNGEEITRIDPCFVLSRISDNVYMFLTSTPDMFCFLLILIFYLEKMGFLIVKHSTNKFKVTADQEMMIKVFFNIGFPINIFYLANVPAVVDVCDQALFDYKEGELDYLDKPSTLDNMCRFFSKFIVVYFFVAMYQDLNAAHDVSIANVFDFFKEYLINFSIY